jgi:aconitate hydratase 2/2-methylisocitrate dehydratase
LGRIPTKEEYMTNVGVIDAASEQIYQYLNFDKIDEYKDIADKVAA